jgi:CRISPR/Cas system-associated exonuclease Cas4 (RecB family)
MRLIRASEIGEYVFCHRAWWLRHVQGYTSTNVRELEAGTVAHSWHGRLVGMASALRVLAVLLLVAALLMILFSLLPNF